MKNIISLIFAVSLTACEATKQPGITVIDNGTPPAVTTPTAPETAPSPATGAADAPKAPTLVSGSPAAPVSPAPVNPAARPAFCIPHELRSNSVDPIPTSGSALWVALIHDGYTDRQADPKCLIDSKIVDGDHTFIPCTINTTDGKLYTRSWQSVDRLWVQNALNREGVLQKLSAGELTVTIGVVDIASRFYVNVPMRTQNLIVLDVKTGDVDFKGYCQ